MTSYNNGVYTEKYIPAFLFSGELLSLPGVGLRTSRNTNAYATSATTKNNNFNHMSKILKAKEK